MNDPSNARGERSRTLGFVTLFLIEMWERFGYYGMTAVVVLYMVQRLSYSDDRANLTFGAFVALAYAIPAAGGFIGDRLLGSRRTLVIGALVLACGYSLLAVPDRPSLLFPALALIAVGGGVFKANPARRSIAPSRCITWRSTSARRFPRSPRP